MRAFAKWLRELWTGDDGQQWAVITEPSMFRRNESKLAGPFTRRQVWRHARRFVAANPYGQARLSSAPKDAPWPPRTNWDPPRREEQRVPAQPRLTPPDGGHTVH